MPKTKTLPAPVKTFTSPHGRTFTVGRGEHSARWPDDPLWSDRYPILQGRKEVGSLFQNMNYSRAGQPPKWQASLSALVWQTTTALPRGLGYDVGPHATARETLAAWAHNADQVLDYWEKELERRERERTHFTPSEIHDLLRRYKIDPKKFWHAAMGSYSPARMSVRAVASVLAKMGQQLSR